MIQKCMKKQFLKMITGLVLCPLTLTGCGQTEQEIVSISVIGSSVAESSADTGYAVSESSDDSTSNSEGDDADSFHADRSTSTDTEHTEQAQGDFKIYYNPPSESILQRNADGTVTNLSSQFDLGSQLRWATYYADRIWYADNNFLYSCKLDGTDRIWHQLPVRLSSFVGSCAIWGDDLYFVGESLTESEDKALYRLPFSVLLESIDEAVSIGSDGDEKCCRAFDVSLLETVLEKTDLREYTIMSLVIFQNRLYFSENWMVRTSDGTDIMVENFSWIDENSNYETVIEPPEENVHGYGKYVDWEYVGDDALYFWVENVWASENSDSLYAGILSPDNSLELIGLDDAPGSNYGEKLLSVIQNYDPAASLDAFE